MDHDISPKVSVLLPVYNAEKFLREAIESILNQTFRDFELLIINDGSTDGSDYVIRSYNDERIRYINHLDNRGLVAVLNEGLACAKGQYIARMDADDISLRERLEMQVKFMEENKNVGASGTAYQLFGDRNNLYTQPTEYQKAFTHLSFNSAIGHPCAIIRTDLLRQHNIRYESAYEYAADYAFWIKIGLVSRITSIKDPLLLYRWHDENMSNTDASMIRGRTKGRVLWYENVLKKQLTTDQKEYLEGDPTSRKIFDAGKMLLLEILNVNDCENLDKEYYGNLNVTFWEIKLIKRFGLKGLLTCLSQPSLRKWSRATTIGLAYEYYKIIKEKYLSKLSPASSKR